MSKVSELTGTPWHVEKLTRNEGDERRHKSRCIFYRKKDSYCKYQYVECMGSRYCQYYKAKEIEEDKKHTDAPAKIKEAVAKTTDSDGMKLYPIGFKVRHQKFGNGYVTEISGGHIIIDFEDVGEKILDLDVCVTKGYLDVIVEAVIHENKEREASVETVSYDEYSESFKLNSSETRKIGWFCKLLSKLFKRGK